MTSFTSPAVEEVWGLIASSIERLLAVAEELEGAGGAEALNWRPAAAEANSVVVLVHHTLENLEDNVVYTVGEPERAAAREREAEFESADATTSALAARWAELRPRCESVLGGLTESDLRGIRAHPRRGEASVLGVLVVVARHAAEHLAHAELTRDLHAAIRSAG